MCGKTFPSCLREVLQHFADAELTVTVTGSGGISVAPIYGLPFLQEVMAGLAAIREFLPDTDVAIELGGEDAKITYITGGLEQADERHLRWGAPALLSTKWRRCWTRTCRA